MADEKDWQQQLLGAAVMAAARTGVEYLTNPDVRDDTVKDVRTRLADVDYNAAARALSKAIDQLAEGSKAAVNEAIDALRSNAEEAVEAAAEKAQEQLGAGKKKGKSRLFLGVLLGLVAGFILLNEDRRNQLMDKLTGASGPIDTTQWSSISSTVQQTGSQAVEAVKETASQVQNSSQAVADEASKQASATSSTAKAEAKKVKAEKEESEAEPKA